MKINDFEIKINLEDFEPGVYTLGINGAEGKTLFYKVVSGSDGQALGITYSNVLTESAVIDLISKSEASFVVLDRYDLYKTDTLHTFLLETNKIIFVDCKDNDFINSHEFRFAKVNMRSVLMLEVLRL